MDEKVRERRRTVNRERGRRRAGWFVLGACLVIVLGLFLWLRSSDVFAVKRITVTALEHVSVEDVSQATADSRGVSLLRLDLGELEDRLLQLPYVRTAELHRGFPNTLEVTLGEYRPVACVQVGGGGRWLVGDDGRVLEKAADPSLPLIVLESGADVEPGVQLPAIATRVLPITAALGDPEVAALLPKVGKIDVSSGGEVTLQLSGSIQLRIGEPTALKQKLKVAGTIIQQYLRDGKELHYVDARVPDRPAVKGD